MILFSFFVVLNEIFCYKICLEAEKMTEKIWSICRKIAFSECYQTPKIVFRTIFHCRTKHPDFIFLTGIYFPQHSFYTRNSVYIEPYAASGSTSFSSFHLSNQTSSKIIFFLFFSSHFSILLKSTKSNRPLNYTQLKPTPAFPLKLF